jgi:hypothetical protein
MKDNINKKGFTIIELTVSIFVIILLITMITINFRQTKQSLVLNRAISKLAQDIRGIQERAMSVKQHNGASPPGGFGVYLNEVSPYSYILFADLNEPPNYHYDGGDEFVDEIYLEEGVEVSQVAERYRTGAINTALQKFSITFTPPDPTMMVDGLAEKDALVELKAGDKTKLLEVNSLGYISVAGTEDCSCLWINNPHPCDPDSCGPGPLTCNPDNPPNIVFDCCCFDYICFPAACCVTQGTCPPEYPSYCDCVHGGKIY